jgi:hypothetical protein
LHSKCLNRDSECNGLFSTFIIEGMKFPDWWEAPDELFRIDGHCGLVAALKIYAAATRRDLSAQQSSRPPLVRKNSASSSSKEHDSARPHRNCREHEIH